jgi:hypothetical protein
MPNPNHDPRNGEFTSGHGIATGLAVEHARRKSGGKPVTVEYIRNNNGIRKHAGADAFGQRQEPWGRYVSDGTGVDHLQPGWEKGKVTFKNPLIVDYADGGWKENLSKKYGGSTGKELSKKLLADGHDGIITKDKYGMNEIVDVRPKAKRDHVVTKRA